MAKSLAYLQMLARERRPSRRHELMRALTDLFLESPHRLTARDIEATDGLDALHQVEAQVLVQALEDASPSVIAPVSGKAGSQSA